VETQQPRPHEVEVIRKGLEVVVRGGIRPAWLVRCRELLELSYVRRRAGGRVEDPYVFALTLERLLLDALQNLGDGPYGAAVALLFGADPESRGQLLKERRRLAAQELRVMPSTFRKNYEADIINDVAIEVWRLARG
jgi:hypothetical protein